MTFTVLKSQLGDDAATFHDRVLAFLQARIDHHGTTDVPAPAAHHLVEGCVRRVRNDDRPDDYVVDYELVDDSPPPTPPPSLRQRKDALLHQVGLRQHELISALLPPGKRPLDHLTAEEIKAKAESEHSHDERAFLAARHARLEHERAINLHAAKQMSAVEDLTEEAVGAWKPAPFPE